MLSPYHGGRRSAVVVAALVFSLAVTLPLVSDAPDSKNFVAHCVGDEEVPARATHAQGQAIFHLSKDGAELAYTLIVANIENVVASHIHIAPAGVNGPIVVFLAGPFPSAGGRSDGIIGKGVITASNLIGPLAGSADLTALATALRNGNAYVNVHTNDGVAPTNTGPGDFPGGEIRAQISVAGPN